MNGRGKISVFFTDFCDRIAQNGRNIGQELIRITDRTCPDIVGICLCGIEDDDGAAAQQQPPKNPGKTKPHGRYARITELKNTAVGLGIKEEGIKSWLDTTFGKPMKDFTDAEIAETEGYLSKLISDMRALNG